MKKTRVVVYLRCSTEEQAEEGLSLQTQESRIRAYVNAFPVDVVATEIDAGRSAKGYGDLDRTLDARPGLGRALDNLRERSADGILVYRLDRLSRSVGDLDRMVIEYFSGDQVLISVSEQIDTRSPGGRLTLNLFASVAQWERETIGDRTRAAMALKRERSEYTGGEPPYGWQVAADGVHLERHAGEQALFPAVRALRDHGMSLREIGARLDAIGRSPRSGRTWGPSSVAALLRPAPDGPQTRRLPPPRPASPASATEGVGPPPTPPRGNPPPPRRVADRHES